MAGERIQVEWELDDGISWDRSKVKLSAPARSFIGGGGRRSAIAEEITEHVQMQIYQRYLEEKDPEMIHGKGKTWLCSRDWLRGNHLEGAWWGPKKARRPLQMVHGWLPTRGMIAKREYPGTEGGKCPLFKVKETTWHAMGICFLLHGRNYPLSVCVQTRYPGVR